MPLYILAQLEGQLGLVVVPCPAGGKLGADVVGGVELLMLIVEHQVVVNAHEGRHRRYGRFLVNRGAGRIVPDVHAQDATLLLREGRTGGGNKQGARYTRYQDGALAKLPHGYPPVTRPRNRRPGASRPRDLLCVDQGECDTGVTLLDSTILAGIPLNARYCRSRDLDRERPSSGCLAQLNGQIDK